MSEYSTLVRQILQVPQLYQRVKEYATDHDALNLVTENWKEHLENHKPFQEFQQNTRNMFQPKYSSTNSMFRIQNIHDHVEPLKVIVAGVCRMYKPYDEKTKTTQRKGLSIVLNESPVMDALTKALTNDVNLNLVQLNTSCKFNLKICSMFCQYCSGAMEKMIANHIKVSSKYLQPCISDTCIFDGKSITNRFGSQILDFFPGSFIAIVKIEFNLRYFYNPYREEKEHVRVGGNALKMICFPESNLKEKQMELGNLDNLAAFSETVVETESSSTSQEPARRKRSLIDEEDSYKEFDDEEDEVIDALPAEKKQKTWADEYSVTEDTCDL